MLVWSLAWANTGNQGTAGVVLHETIPAHTTFQPQGSDPRWSCTGSGPGAPCTLELGEVPAGASGEAAFAVTVDTPLPAGVEATENCAQLTTAESCHTAALDAAPDLALTKDDGGVTVRPGGVVTYTLTAVNHGNQDADGVAVTDRLPPGTLFSAEGTSPGWSCSAEPPATLAALPGPGADAGDGPPVIAGVPVEFHDRSTGLPTTWEWDFEYDFLVPTTDSTEQSPTWTYPDPGTYAVRLQVCNALGCDVRIRFIDVLPGGEPPAEIFADGFETGDLSRWVGVVP